MLEQAISLLKERNQQIIMLKYFEGFTLIEIAEILKCPLGTAKTRLHHALQELRGNLGREDLYDE